LSKSTRLTRITKNLNPLRRSANFKKNKRPENVAIQSIEMKNSLINDELDRDLQSREKELEAFNKNLMKPEDSFDDSDEDTVYETMLDIQLRKEDSKSFFDNQIQGKSLQEIPEEPRTDDESIKEVKEEEQETEVKAEVKPAKKPHEIVSKITTENEVFIKYPVTASDVILFKHILIIEIWSKNSIGEEKRPK
jgi:hypothetical protein